MTKKIAMCVAAALLAGCSDLTKVDAPDLVQRPSLENANGAVTMFYGAVKAFYSGANSMISSSALFADEVTLAATTTVGLDQRVNPDLSGSGGFSTQSTMRAYQLQTLGVLRSALPAQRWRMGAVFNFLAFHELWLAEAVCSGTPLGSLTADFAPVWGPPLTNVELLQRALADFDSALVYSTDSVRFVNLAAMGRGRTLLALNRLNDAAAAVSAVPTSYAFATEHSTATISNSFGATFVAGGGQTLADREGINGLNFISANDPRVATTLVGRGGDGSTNVYRLNRISAVTSPHIIATGTEARLIEGEAALRAGDVAGWLAKLNDLRATAISPAMTPLTDPGTTNSRVDLLFRERAFWLYLTGHRMGDLRRLLRQYGRTQETTYPTGPYKYGGSYGGDVVVGIDIAEVQLNPLLNGKGCTNRDP